MSNVEQNPQSLQQPGEVPGAQAPMSQTPRVPPQAPPVKSTRRPLGVIALALAILAIVASPLSLFIMNSGMAEHVDSYGATIVKPDGPLYVIGRVLVFVFAAVGFAGFVIGILAAVRKPEAGNTKSRVYGIAAIIISVLGAVLTFFLLVSML